MALEAEGKHFCKLTHTENGKVMSRRVHWMTVQAEDGRLYHLSGQRLPDAIALHTGAPYRGKHLAEVLLNPRPPAPESLDSSWPTGRDFLHYMAGMMTMGWVMYFIHVFVSAFNLM